jgi:hypothetical protein
MPFVSYKSIFIDTGLLLFPSLFCPGYCLLKHNDDATQTSMQEANDETRPRNRNNVAASPTCAE